LDIELERVCTIARGAGMDVLRAWKPDWNCYHHMLLRGTAEQIRRVEREYPQIMHNRCPSGGQQIRRVPTSPEV
jgi:hypothetical protein